ncbi:MAG: type IV toxin-antitoxin system AbiEi family antitoxin domain-containing protein [Candidatus Nanopelagicales bacterium]|jgi:hypothetical protein|nr:type IV toxin-antitoxin system AbiEi family antitoxin domain-containing protein [Candidatus Nanopelagicales bacterium]
MPRLNPSLRGAIEAVGAFAEGQAGAVTSQQARRLGITRDGLSRLVSAGRWRRLHRGVLFVGHGDPGLDAQMWGAHLALGPRSVIGGRTAGRAWGFVEEPQGDEPIAMMLPDGSSRRARGVVVRRVPEPAVLVHPARVPPILTVEHAVIECFQQTDDPMAAAGLVMRACRQRLTTPDRVLAAAAQRPRLRGRGLLLTLCADAADGVTSPLEAEYRNRVERAHGLPVGSRQDAVSSGRKRRYRDVRYRDWGVLVELDGRLGHETESEVFRDQDRDNRATLTGEATLRYGWLAVMGAACSTALQVEALLRLRGWTGAARPCGQTCAVRFRGDARAA